MVDHHKFLPINTVHFKYFTSKTYARYFFPTVKLCIQMLLGACILISLCKILSHGQRIVRPVNVGRQASLGECCIRKHLVIGQFSFSLFSIGHYLASTFTGWLVGWLFWVLTAL